MQHSQDLLQSREHQAHVDATLGMRAGRRPPLATVPPLAAAWSWAGTSASSCSWSRAYGGKRSISESTGTEPRVLQAPGTLAEGLGSLGSLFQPSRA